METPLPQLGRLGRLGRLSRRTLIVVVLLLAALTAGSAYLPARAWAAAPVALTHAFSDTDGMVASDFDLLGALRLLQGDSGLGGAVRPHSALTRAEFAVLVLRLRGLEVDAQALAGKMPAFADGAEIPAWAWGYVNAAKAHGLIRGFEDGTFRPGQGVFLAEGIAMLSRLLEREDELDSGQAWPQSYLELGDRIGLSGRFAGHSNLGLDRSGIAHLSATALTVPVDRAGSGRTLLRERYGFRRGLLQAAGNGSITVAGSQPSVLADPYLCSEGTIDPLVGRLVDIVLLPGSGEAAMAVPSGAAPWCPEGYLGYYSDQAASLVLETVPWWQGLLDLEAAAASRYSSTGRLSSPRVRLFLPQTDGGEAFGVLRVKGTTDRGGLIVGDQLGGVVPIQTTNGRFDQLLYFSSGRGSYRLQFMTPVPGKANYYCEDVGFGVENTLMLVNDSRYEAGFTWPRVGLVQAEGYVDVAGFAGGSRVHIQVTCGHEFALHHLPVADGYFSGRIWLTHGPGRYEVRLCLDSSADSTYLLTDASFRVDSISAAPGEWAAPGIYIQSGNAAVHELAAKVTAGEETTYGKAKAIYRWVARNLTYDLVRAADPNGGQLTTLEILARRKGVCEDYANVFAAMCRTMGIECRVAIGLAIVQNQNHAWSEFRDGGRWVSVDATWGAGYVADGVFHPDPSDGWFDRDLGATHVRQGVRSDWRADI